MGFALNEKKTRVMGKHNRQTVTGIVVNQVPQASRAYRRKLRSELYYCRRYGTAEHIKRIGSKAWMTAGEPDAERYRQHLLGKLNYVLQINPRDEYFKKAREELMRGI